MALNVGELFASLFCEDSEFRRGLASAEQALEATGRNFVSIGKGLALGVTAPLAGIAALTFKTTSNFNDSMSEVAAMSGVTGDELLTLRDKAKEMGETTTFSAKEAADGLKYMALAGWDTQTSLKSIEPVLRLAEAGAMELGRTSDLVTDSMSALGIGSEDLSMFLDQTAMASARSNTNIDALMQAMIESGGTLRNLNVPLDEANTLFGLLANRGIKGSQAGNAFNSIMINLTTGAGAAGEAMRELGLDAFDSEGKFKGVTSVLAELREKTEGMTEEQKNFYLASIGGKTQLSTLQALLSGVGEEYGELRGAIIDSEGALNQMAITMQDNVGGAYRGLKSALEGLMISFGETMEPFIKKAIEGVTGFVSKLTDLDESMKIIILVMAAVAAAVGPVLIVVGTLMGIISTIGVVVAAKIVAITALITALISAYAASETFRNVVKEVFAQARDFLVKAFTTMKTKVLEFRDYWVQEFQPVLVKFEEWTKIILPEIQKVFVNSFGLIWDVVELVWDIFSSFLLPILKALYEWVKPYIPIIQRIIQDSFTLIIKIIDSVITAVRNLIDWFKNLIDAAKEFFGLSGGGGLSSGGGGSSYMPRDFISYDVGSPRVPRDMLAQIHKDEMIVPAEYNPNNPSASKVARGGINYEQNIIINSAKALSPAEIARKTKQASRALALEWAVE